MSIPNKALKRSGDPLRDLVEVMRRLRDRENGCPWDIEQDYASIAPYTLEEAYEVYDAISRDDMTDLKEELGDLLLQVVFHSQMASESNEFTINDVAETIVEKMVRRHPHVFADADIATADAQTSAWEEVKAQERALKASQKGEPVKTAHSAMDGVALALPALTRSEKLLKRAARTGFEWKEIGQLKDKLSEELSEVEEAAASTDQAALEEEVGDLLIVAANIARFYKVDPEAALRKANEKFEKRFRGMEQRAASTGALFSDLDLPEMIALWAAVKETESVS